MKSAKFEVRGSRLMKPALWRSNLEPRTSHFALIAIVLLISAVISGEERPRIRDLGIRPGVLPPGKWNAITDVAGIRVGHTTIVEGDSIRTGVTAILPHGGNLFQRKVPAAV